MPRMEETNIIPADEDWQLPALFRPEPDAGERLKESPAGNMER